VWMSVVCLATSLAAPAPLPYPLALDIIDMAAISRMTPQQLERLAEGLAAEEIMRTKRSSAQALTSVVSKASSGLSSGLQSKVGLLGQASAGAASLIASASSKNGHSSGGDHGYSYEPHDDKYDYWGLKKSILYTLFQAVKAITGGVTILKGQLIKGGGALAATLGKVISGKGDVVSNLGKKIVSSAALSNKKPHGEVPVYGPPEHVEYGPPTGYSAPTAPAHYSHTAPAAPTSFAAHKYPSHLDGRGKLNGLYAGAVLLTPLGDAAPSETHDYVADHTPLEPPPSILHTVYSAIKNVFTPPPAHISDYSPSPTHHPQEDIPAFHPPPPPQPVPSFKPMSWDAVNSYGEPAMVEAYQDYDPRHPHPPFNYAMAKHSNVPYKQKSGLTADKIQKIKHNLKKLQAAYMNDNQRSSEVLPTFVGFDRYQDMLNRGQVPLFPTPVVSDNEIGVLPAEFLPEPVSTNNPTTTSSTTTSTSTTTTTTTTPKPKTTAAPDGETNRRKDVKYILRGNKIVQV
ncbi:hypothetical protein evm_007937, partial [Chilo suppressalis]